MFSPDRLVERFMTLVQIDSPSGEEEGFRTWLLETLTSRGIKGYVQDGNLFAEIPGEMPGPTVMFSAHLDTVMPGRGIKPKLFSPDGTPHTGPLTDDTRIMSSGDTILGADDKAGIAAILEMLDALEGKSHLPLVLMFSFGEEVGLRGAKALKEKPKADFAYVLDASGEVGTLINQAPSQESIQITVQGRAAHAGIAPETGLNAIMVAGHLMTKLHLGRIDEETTANIGMISGGIATNIVPDQVLLQGEARSRSLEKLERQVSSMRQAAEEVAKSFGTEIVFEANRAYPPYQLDPESPIVRVGWAAAESAGLRPVLAGTGGGSDANILNALGMPAMVLGMGWKNVHTTREEITVGNLGRIARLVLAIALSSGR